MSPVIMATTNAREEMETMVFNDFDYQQAESNSELKDWESIEDELPSQSAVNNPQVVPPQEGLADNLPAWNCAKPILTSEGGFSGSEMFKDGSEGTRYDCYYCPKEFKGYYNRRHHILLSHPGKPHKIKEDHICDVCQACFTSFGKLCKHRRLHDREESGSYGSSDSGGDLKPEPRACMGAYLKQNSFEELACSSRWLQHEGNNMEAEMLGCSESGLLVVPRV